MTGSSIASTWMLPLLLLPICCCECRSTATLKPKEFRTNVESFGKSVENCPKNCSSVHITHFPKEEHCRCFNLTLSAGECGLPHHYTKYLKSLYPNNTNKEIMDLLENLEYLGGLSKQLKLCNYTVMQESISSPKKLHEVLHTLTELYNSLPRQ